MQCKGAKVQNVKPGWGMAAERILRWVGSGLRTDLVVLRLDVC
jgi:hypothetical protein